MAPEHRTSNSDLLSRRIRSSSLFTSHVLVHPGNIFEEPAMYEAIAGNEDLLRLGFILPVIRGDDDDLENHAEKWERAYRGQDDGRPAFFQSRPVDLSDIDGIKRRAEFFQQNEYQILRLGRPDRTGLGTQFLAAVRAVLADEPGLPDEVKSRIVECASGGASPLGRIRTEVLDPYGVDEGTKEVAERVARRINVAFFATGARELGTWCSMHDRAFRDLSTSTTANRAVTSQLVELSVTRALRVPEEHLTAISGEEFARIVNETYAVKFRQLVAQIMEKLNQEFLEAGSAAEPSPTKAKLQEEVDSSFRDTYGRAFAKALKEYRVAEQRRDQRLRRTMRGISLATDLLTGLLPVPFVGAAVDAGIDALREKTLRPRLTPMILLQERLHRAEED
ncbi:hypothetical protein ACQPZX_20820 [Actinoplanes sp. CA-142083]|uniref:hypothetical protein n=1 Tax=Actinoplanes sp. CA-142083 TaxID=3239903 RepID=UPI003D8BB212